MCQNYFPELRHASIALAHVSVTQIVRFLNLPNLRNLEVRYDSDSHHLLGLANEHKITTCVERFHAYIGPLHPMTMQAVIASARSTLTSLNVMMPGRTTHIYNGSPGVQMLDAFSPKSMRAMLQPVRATLRTLALQADAMLWPSHDGSILDLGHFVSLKNVKLSSLFLFRFGSSARDRNGVWRLLPPSIEKLSVCSAYWYAQYAGILINLLRLSSVTRKVCYTPQISSTKTLSTNRGIATRRRMPAPGCPNWPLIKQNTFPGYRLSKILKRSE